MGARVYLPTAGRFLQVDPIEGGTPNSYVYPGDPVNGQDYSGLLGVVMSSSNVRLTVVYNYGMQPSPAVTKPKASQRLQNTASARRTQGPGSFRSNFGRATVYKPPKGVEKHGINLNLGVIGYGSISFGIAHGKDGSAGLYATTGVGATTGFSSGVGPERGRHSSAVGVGALRGTQPFGGASGGVGGFGAGCDLSQDEIVCSGGVGFDWSIGMPMEGHTGVEKTWVLQLW